MAGAWKAQMASAAIGLFVLGLLIGKNAVVEPARYQLTNLRAKQDSEQRKAEALSQVAQLESRVAGYRGVLLERRDVSAFIESINRMADESGVSLASVTPMSLEKLERGYIKIPIQIELKCRYHHIGRFVSRIESSPVFIKIESLRIQKQSEGTEEEDSLSISMILNGFSRAS